MTTRRAGTTIPGVSPIARGLLLVLVAALFLVPVGGALVVPDFTQFGGVYDGADGDEVAILVWDQTHAVIPTVVALLTLAGAFIGAAPCFTPAGSRPLRRTSSRAPPLSA